MSDTPPVDAPAFTPPKDQADFDRMIGERLARERQKFADYDDLRAKAERLNELEAANRSELEKAQAAIAERDAKLADLPKQVRGQILRFASTASAKGFIDPEDALLGIDPDVDLADNAAVATALDDLAARKPHLVREQKRTVPRRPKPEGGTGGDSPDGDLGSLQGKERAAAALRQFRNT